MHEIVIQARNLNVFKIIEKTIEKIGKNGNSNQCYRIYK